MHAGLTQRYRGIGEVCVFAAICEGATDYGVTLHRILPRQTVDAGPVVDQIEFPIDGLCFWQVMELALDSCRRIFERNVRQIADGFNQECSVIISPRPLRYRDIPHLMGNTPADRLERACDLGKYAGYLPKMREALHEFA